MKPAKIAKPPASTPNTPDARSPSWKRLPSGAPRLTNSIAPIATALATSRITMLQWRLMGAGPGRGPTAVEPPRCARMRSLPGHGDAQALLCGDQVVDVLGVFADVELHPAHAAREDAPLGRVVVADGRGGVLAEIGCLVAGESSGTVAARRPSPTCSPSM